MSITYDEHKLLTRAIQKHLEQGPFMSECSLAELIERTLDA